MKAGPVRWQDAIRWEPAPVMVAAAQLEPASVCLVKSDDEAPAFS